MHQNSCSKRLRLHEELLQCWLMVCVVTAVCSLAAAVVVYLSGAACLLIGAFIYKYLYSDSLCTLHSPPETGFVTLLLLTTDFYFNTSLLRDFYKKVKWIT